MALANTTDYARTVNQLLYFHDNVFGGIDWERLPIYSQMLPEDAATIRAAYATYKKTRDARPADDEVAPDAHGANGSTILRG